MRRHVATTPLFILEVKQLLDLFGLLLLVLIELIALLVSAVGAGLAYAVLSLPPVATGLKEAVADQLAQSGVSNPVTAVLLSFRGYDTLHEMGVLLLAPGGRLVAEFGTVEPSGLPGCRVGSSHPVLGAADDPDSRLIALGWRPCTRRRFSGGGTGRCRRVAAMGGVAPAWAAGGLAVAPDIGRERRGVVGEGR